MVEKAMLHSRPINESLSQNVKIFSLGRAGMALKKMAPFRYTFGRNCVCLSTDTKRGFYAKFHTEKSAMFVSIFAYLRDVTWCTVVRSIFKKKKRKSIVFTIDRNIYNLLTFRRTGNISTLPFLLALVFSSFFSFLFLLSFSLFFDTVKNVETHPSFHDASPKCKIDRAVGSCRHCRVTGASVLAPRVFDTTICVDPTIWYSTIDYLSIRHCEYQFTPHYLFWRTNLFARSFGRIIHDPSGKRMT